MTDRYYPESHKRFLADVTEPGHQLTVLHDDGLYRHLRFKRPDTGMYWFDLITWPGVLTISSDMGHYMFSRTKDMFEFFTASDYINPGYWQEKCTAQDVHSPIKRYSEAKFKAQVIEHYAVRTRSIPGWAQPEALEAVMELVNSDEIGNAQDAHAALNNFHWECYEQHPGLPRQTATFEFTDTWDWELTDFSAQFLWCCHAIQYGIHEYRKAKVPV